MHGPALRLAPLSILFCTGLAFGAASAATAERKAPYDARSGTASNHETTRVGASGQKPVAGSKRRFILPGTVNDPAADVTRRDTQSTTTTVDLGGGRRVAAWIDTGSFDGEFGGGDDHFVGYAYSSDDGATWTDAGTLPDSRRGDGGWPVLAYHQASGSVYLATTVVRSSFARRERIQVFKSVDGGRTFGAPVNGTPGYEDYDFRTGHRRPWIAVDNFPGPGNGNIYLCRRFSEIGVGGESYIAFTRSTDGGRTFGPVPSTAIGGSEDRDHGVDRCFVVVGPSHQVSVFYLVDLFDIEPFGGAIRARHSLDHGVTWGPVVTVAFVYGGSQHPLPHAAVDPATGRLYVIYNHTSPDDPFRENDIYLVRSNDGGLTWTRPIAVAAGARSQFLPTIAFNDSGSRVMASWYSARHPGMHRRHGRLGRPGAAGEITWFNTFQLGPDTPFIVAGQDPAMEARPFFGGGFREYDQISSGTAFGAVWSDNRLGNAFHQYQPDVRFALIEAHPPATNLVVDVSAPGSVPLGGLTTVTVTASASRGAANDVFVSMAPTTGLTPRSATAGTGPCTVIRGFIGCSLGRIDAGSSKSVEIDIAAVETGTTTVEAFATTSSRENSSVISDTQDIAVVSGSRRTQTFSTGSVSIPLPRRSTCVNPTVEIRSTFPCREGSFR
jgi:hypothetical protein